MQNSALLPVPATPAWIRQNKSVFLQLLQGWAITRALLVLTAWFSQYFPANSVYQRYIDAGHQFSRFRLLDIWARWDSEWYLSIVKFGYIPGETLGEGYSNLAFFPLYPYLVKLFTFFLPASLRTNALLIAVGLLISNVLFIAALCCLYELGRSFFGESSGLKAVLLTLALPGAYFFSAFYTEALFLFLIVFAFYFAEHDRWAWAAFFAMLASLTRPHGILLTVPLLLFYLRSRNWQLRRIQPNLAWLLLVPLGVLLHFGYLYQLTGDPLAFFKAQSVWGRTVGSIFDAAFFGPLTKVDNQVAWVDFLLILTAIVVSVWLLLHRKHWIYGIYSLLCALILLNSGSFYSMSRYVSVIFPLTLFLSGKIRSNTLFRGLCLFLWTLQVLLYAGWVNYYWIA